jgi:preprotein translocase subunit SecD
MDDRVRTAATIQSRIEDSGRITGLSNEQDANDLALVLRSGPLPVRVAIVEEH